MRRATVAIVGRPNVGKSTLFNRIVGGRRAIVHDRPGVTRDRHFGRASWAGRDFWLVDTGGWVTGTDDALLSAIREQVEMAIQAADAVVLVVDTLDGVHPADRGDSRELQVDRALGPACPLRTFARNGAFRLTPCATYSSSRSSSSSASSVAGRASMTVHGGIGPR